MLSNLRCLECCHLKMKATELEGVLCLDAFFSPLYIINTYFLPTDEEGTQSDELSGKWLYCRHLKLDEMRPIFLPSGMFQRCWLKSLALAGTPSAGLSEIVLW